MDNSWVKLYRKIAGHEILFDTLGLRVFVWLLTQVDKKTGTVKIGRFTSADRLRMNGNTFYKVLKRLEKKYKMVTCVSNNKYTEISLLNWAKYNPYNEKVTGSSNNKVTSKQQQSNTIQDNKTIDNKTYKYIHADKPRVPVKVEKKWERKPPDKQTAIHRIGYYFEDTVKTNIVNWGKAGKAVTNMISAGYTEEQIKATINRLLKDDFYTDKGFDLMTVSNEIPRFKASVKRMEALNGKT